MRASTYLALIIILQLSLSTLGQRGRSKYRPLKTSYFDPLTGVFRRTPYSPKDEIDTTTSTLATTAKDSTTAKVYKYFHHPEDVILSTSNIFDKKYKRPEVPELTYDFSIGRGDVAPVEEEPPLLEDPDVESLKRLYDYTIGRDKQPGVVKKKKIYFDVEEVRDSDEVENSVEDVIRKRPSPIIKFRTQRVTTEAASYFLPTIATDTIRTTTTTTTITTTTTTITTTTPLITTTEPERSTWGTTTTTEKQFSFSKKSSIREHYRNMNKEGSRPQVAKPYPTHDNTKFPHFPEQPIGSSPAFFAPKSEDVLDQIKGIQSSVGDIIHEEIARATTARPSRSTTHEWNVKKRIRSKLNLNKKRRILSVSTSTTSTTTQEPRRAPITTTEISSSGILETRHRYFYTKSDQEPQTLRQNPDIYHVQSKTTTPSNTQSSTTYPHFFIEDFREPIPPPEDLKQGQPFQTYMEHPKVPNLLDFHPSYNKQNFAPRDNFYVRLEELEQENEFQVHRKPNYIPRGHSGFRRKGTRRNDRPRPNRRSRWPNRRPRHPENTRQRFNSGFQRRRGPPKLFK